MAPILNSSVASCGKSGGSNMQERLLLKCDNSIYADEITELLRTHQIVSRQHDETQDLQPGAYGAVTGIAIYVFEKDYAKAQEVVAPVLAERKNMFSFCPKCGSEEIEVIVRRHDYGTCLILTCLFLIFLPGLYICLPAELGLRSMVTDYIAGGMLVFGFVLMFAIRNIAANYQCRKCGKKFNRR